MTDNLEKKVQRKSKREDLFNITSTAYNYAACSIQ